ncbi:hypothetical protein [Alloactinosynnema sp. L-07]|uniref:hypothetical protein n=1 Tax=Alloactinosynnema sp. L-07 TaxID=1653480 RepID=UPI0015610BDE|nr:hypothetical protein [Alloactinosynnema sp. L-07]
MLSRPAGLRAKGNEVPKLLVIPWSVLSPARTTRGRGRGSVASSTKVTATAGIAA